MAPMPLFATAPGRTALRFALILLPGVAFVALLFYGLAQTGGPPAPGDDAPGFEAPLLEGAGTLSLAGLEGKPVVLNFWASWCVPCRDEAPWFKKAHARYGDRIHFVGVDIHDARSDAIAFVDEYGLEYPSVRDLDGRIEGDYGLTGQPETFLIDAGGTIVEHVPGAFSDEATLMGLLEDLAS